MDTLCDQVIQSKNSDAGDNDTISNEEEKKSSTISSLEKVHQSHDSNIKLKRCKHGRIIVKDLSKKKPVQQHDAELTLDTNQFRSLDTIDVDTNQSHLQAGDCLPKATPDVNTSVNLNSSIPSSFSISNNRLPSREDKEDSSTEPSQTTKCPYKPVNHQARERVKSPKRGRRSKSKSRSPTSRKNRGRSPLRRRCSSRSASPSRKKSHSKERDRSPYNRYDSLSPRRRDRDRSPLIRRRRGGSPRRRSRYKSPNRHRSNHRGHRHSSRNRSPRRHPSTSPSPYRETLYADRSRRDTSRTPPRDQYKHDWHSRVSGPERSVNKKDVYDSKSSRTTEDRKSIRTDTMDSGVVDSFSSSNQVLDEKTELNQQPPRGLAELILAQPPPPQNSKLSSPHVPQPETSPKDSPPARSPATPPSNNSAGSDIYDPEGPVLPISPGDSPPLSPMNEAAYQQLTRRLAGEKNGEDDVPSSAVQLNQQEKYLQKLNRQERVIEEVKMALKPHYQCRAINKEQYKDVLRRAVPKICHSKNGEINPVKISSLVDAYVRKMKRFK